MHTTRSNTTSTSKRTAMRSARSIPADDHTVTAIRASQVENVAAEELEWFFTTPDDDGAAFAARATIQAWLSALPIEQQRSIALRFDRTPWPEAFEVSGVESGYALAISLVTLATWTPHSKPHHEAHRPATDHLEHALRQHGVSVMKRVGRTATWEFTTALRAYANARGRTPSVIPRRVA